MRRVLVDLFIRVERLMIIPAVNIALGPDARIVAGYKTAATVGTRFPGQYDS
jgi:hypothetical protein